MTFDLHQPESIEAALSVLAKYGEDARVIAGGQSLLLLIRAGLLRPRVLVSLASLDDLKGISVSAEGGIRIGPLTTYRRMLESSPLKQTAGVLLDAVSRVGSTPVRNFGTIGGNLCHNEMGSDPPAALLVLNATVECRGPRGRRTMPLSDFVTDYFATCLAPDEILSGIEIPAPLERATAVYLKHSSRPGDLAIVGVAAWLDIDNGFCREARLALGGVGPVPFRVTEAEKLLAGAVLSDQLIEAAAASASAMADPLSDAHASANYRKKLIRVSVVRAIKQAITAFAETNHEAAGTIVDQR